MRALKTSTNKLDFTIDKDDFKLLKQGKPVSQYPYMVFQVSADTKRDDWREIPDIKLAHEALKKKRKQERLMKQKKPGGLSKEPSNFLMI